MTPVFPVGLFEMIILLKW